MTTFRSGTTILLYIGANRIAARHAATGGASCHRWNRQILQGLKPVPDDSIRWQIVLLSWLITASATSIG